MLPNVYSDSEKYIFVSYSHEDKAVVLPIVEKLAGDGFCLWYDSGIHPGTEWAQVIAKQIKHCYYFLAFISDHYLKSDNCLEELDYARRQGKKRLVVYLEEVTLPDELDMRLGHIQSIQKYRYKTEEPFFAQLYSSDNIDSCKLALPIDPTPQKSTPQKSTPQKPAMPKTEKPVFKIAPVSILLLSTILLIVACLLRVGTLAFSLLLAVIAINILIKPICAGLIFRIWSSICFWLANLLAARSLFESIIKFADSGMPIWLYDFFFMLVFAVIYYIPKWLEKAKNKRKIDIVLAAISIVLVLGLAIGAALTETQGRRPNGKFQALPTRYEDDFFGIGFYIPDGWDYRDSIGCIEYEDEYKNKLIDIASLNLRDDDPAVRMESVAISLDMIAENEAEESRVSMIHLRFNEDVGLIDYQFRIHSVYLQEFIERHYDDTIFSELSMHIGTKKMSGTIYKTDDFCVYLFYVIKDEYATVFILETPDRDTTEALTEYFYLPSARRTIEMLWQPLPHVRKTSLLQTYSSY